MTTPINVDIWADIACPWCFIGKRKFEEGLKGFDGEVNVTYHSYELAPDTPIDFEGSEVDFLAHYKGMPKAQVEQMLASVKNVAAEVGLNYDFDGLQHTRTFKAHEAIHFAKLNGKQVEMVERLYSAYFEQGKHLGHVDELVAIGAEVGLNPNALREALENADFAEDVNADINQARSLGINGVPFFVFNYRVGVSGAQSPEIFAQVLNDVAKEAAGAQDF